MNTPPGPDAHAGATPWSVDERHALRAVRMRFVRWLSRTGQLVP